MLLRFLLGYIAQTGHRACNNVGTKIMTFANTNPIEIFSL